MKECGRMLKAIGAPDAPKTSRNVKTVSVVRVQSLLLLICVHPHQHFILGLYFY